MLSAETNRFSVLRLSIRHSVPASKPNKLYEAEANTIRYVAASNLCCRATKRCLSSNHGADFPEVLGV